MTGSVNVFTRELVPQSLFNISEVPTYPEMRNVYPGQISSVIFKLAYATLPMLELATFPVQLATFPRLNW